MPKLNSPLQYVRNHKFRAITVIIIFGLFIGLFLARGWIRGSVVPSYADAAYKPRVMSAFNQSYPNVQKRLSTAGIELPMPSASSPAAYCQRITEDPSTLTFKGFRETVNCYRLIGSKETAIDTAFVSAWNSQAASLDTYLRSQGYRIEENYNPRPSINNLFNLETDDTERMVSYSKQIGDVECILQLYSMNYRHQNYTGYSTATAAPAAFADYQCGNALILFGGYDYFNG